MDTVTFETALLEEAVCQSKEKELHVFAHAQSGRGWVQIGNRRYVGRNYVAAARRLHEHQKLALKHTSDHSQVFELGHHVCAKAAK